MNGADEEIDKDQTGALTRQDRLVEACDDNESASDTEELVNKIAASRMAQLEAEFMALQRTRADLDKTLGPAAPSSSKAQTHVSRMDSWWKKAGFKPSSAASTSSRSLPLPAHNNEKVVRDESDESEEELSEFESVDTHSEACRRSPVTHKEHTEHSGFGVIYKITCMVTRLAYVGLTMQDLGDRMSGHRTAGRTAAWPGKSLASAIAQYGWQAFNVEVLYRGVPLEVLGAMERVCISLHGTRWPLGHNRTSGGEFTRMTPQQRVGWEVQMALHGTPKQVATKRARREEKLAKMEPAVADALRERLDKEAERNKKRHRGEQLEPDGRFGRNEKRRATFAAKREAKMALMSPMERAKYERINANKRRSDEKRIAKRMEANRSTSHVEWMKDYRKATKHKRVLLGD